MEVTTDKMAPKCTRKLISNVWAWLIYYIYGWISQMYPQGFYSTIVSFVSLAFWPIIVREIWSDLESPELYSLQSTANWGPNKQFPAQNVIELLFSRLALTSENSIYLLMKKVPYLG